MTDGITKERAEVIKRWLTMKVGAFPDDFTLGIFRDIHKALDGYVFDSTLPKQCRTYPHKVTIECPSCHEPQEAEVKFYITDPFPTFFHVCDMCGYEINETEWLEI